MKKKFLIIGVGNSLRNDDGIGAYVCQKIDELHLPNVSTKIVQQADTGLLPYFEQYDYVVFVDASVKAQQVVLTKAKAIVGHSSSHHTSVEMLYALATELYGRGFAIYTCAVPASDFNFGEKISARGLADALEAANQIIGFINDTDYPHQNAAAMRQ